MTHNVQQLILERERISKFYDDKISCVTASFDFSSILKEKLPPDTYNKIDSIMEEVNRIICGGSHSSVLDQSTSSRPYYPRPNSRKNREKRSNMLSIINDNMDKLESVILKYTTDEDVSMRQIITSFMEAVGIVVDKNSYESMYNPLSAIINIHCGFHRASSASKSGHIKNYKKGTFSGKKARWGMGNNMTLVKE